MKCKSWSNKFNNFVVRRLKSVKLNGQQQQQHQYPQYFSTCSTMPAMPKEKTLAVSLSESNYPESVLKEQIATTTAVVASTATLGTGTASVTNMSVSNLLQHEKPNQMFGYGAESADVVDGSYTNKRFFRDNEHSSQFSEAVDSGLVSSIQYNTTCRDNQLQNSNSDKNATKTESSDLKITSSETVNAGSAITPPKKSAKDFIFRKYIGEGSFSTVYLAVDIHTKRQYAIKVCAKRQIVREHKQEYIRREREVMHMLTNVPGFVNLSCTFQDSRSLYFVMTFAKNGDLRPYINKVGSFDTDCTRHYVAELVLACEEMHCRNIVHRDLKPENILLDENMHTLIADFGAAKILTSEDQPKIINPSRPTEFDDLRISRRDSFVGTPQYISPEMLQNERITPAIDLWALGCIVYQMISGLPPFRGKNIRVIFKEILTCNLEFPQGFDKDAEDLVRKLLKVDPRERLGSQDKSGKYESIRAHPFFSGIDFDTIRQKTPPPIYPYLPGVSKDEDFLLHMSENLEPGLGDKQITRLLGIELGTAISSDHVVQRAITNEEKTTTKNIFDLSKEEKELRLQQQKSDKWHVFAPKEVILKKGYVNKRKGLFSRKRMLLLTTGPKLIYIDPVEMIKKGEIPWTKELRVEPKNFKIFFVHTENRTYYLEDPEGYSLEWVNAIENMHMLRYKNGTATNEPNVTPIESSKITTSTT